MTLEERYYKDWVEFWLPIYTKQVNEAKVENDEPALKEIYDNIDKSWNLQPYKHKILDKLGISIIKKPITIVNDIDIDSEIIMSYFKNRQKKERKEYAKDW